MQLLQLAKRLLAVTFALTLACSAALSARAEEAHGPTSWSDWRSYTPSLALGFGATIESMASTARGEAHLANSTTIPFPPNLIQMVNASSTTGLKGVTIQILSRLLAPEFDLPARPRLFLHAGYTAQIQEPSALAEHGAPTALWSNQVTPLFRSAQVVDPVHRAHAGVGASFLLPVEMYEVRLNTHINYAVSHLEIENQIWWTDDTLRIGRPYGTSQSLTTHAIAPGVGFDIGIDRRGPLALGFFGDLMLGIPLAGKSITDTNAPPPGVSIDYRLERDLTYDIAIGLRLSWVGR